MVILFFFPVPVHVFAKRKGDTGCRELSDRLIAKDFPSPIYQQAPDGPKDKANPTTYSLTDNLNVSPLHWIKLMGIWV